MRVSFSRLFVLVLLSTAGIHGVKAVHVRTTVKADSSHSESAIVNFAVKHLHIPYRSGGTSKKGFDCSGFVRYCFNKWNITLPHSSAAQATHGAEVNLDDARPGDLIFFKGESVKSKNIGHVGIITDVAPNSIRFIHSAWNGGIRYDLLDASYYRKRFVAVKRLLD
ncbi:C40 family peptidase [Dyadobacter sandarakinus]|uniref:C40 family peptidase n=1 Tax=Dyadobacter sandarakinus TaxID=2747268 RepID=A0ABX7IDU2_9BACT|nr:C40 family peptidase [Dyadobacter sandarakinus]QRR03066.1 C40 family peptidase [Dyadobacter sandarakinus]